MSFSTQRIAAGLSLDDVSRNFCVSAASVRAWEDGVRQPPPHIVESLSLIADGPDEPPADAPLAHPESAAGPDGMRPPQTEFPITRDEGPLFKSGDLIKSKKRVADHGEVFTPRWLVEKMLELVKGESERIDSRFLEPACGSGNFLVEILWRKLATVEAKYGKSAFDKKLYALQALACCYGIELLEDNIIECRANMLEVFVDYLGIDESDEFYRAAGKVLSLNLIHGDAMTMKAADGGPLMIVEWSYLGKAGKFNRRDFRLANLTKRSGFDERWATPDSEQKVSLFGEPRRAFHQRGRDEIFQPIASYPPMTVRELAALDTEPAA